MKHAFLSIVIPCFNETNRLHLLYEALVDFSKEWKGRVEVIIVDDGSQDGTYEAAQSYLLPLNRKNFSVQIEKLEKNEGKGGAIQKGVFVASGDFILTMDADVATHPLQLLQWLEIIESPSRFPSNVVFIGNRKHKASSIKVKGIRKFLGSIYNFFIRTITPIKERDTQCGFKLYPNDIAKLAFDDLKIKSWAHDLEVLLKVSLMGVKIQSMPVDWHHVDDEKISVFSDGLIMGFNSIYISFLVKNDKKLLKKLESFKKS